MGDIAATEACERFIQEFEKDLLDKNAIHAHSVVDQHLCYDIHFNVRIRVLIQETSGENRTLWDNHIYFSPFWEKTVLLDTLVQDLELEEDQIPDLEKRLVEVSLPSRQSKLGNRMSFF